jgi:hypothetical protein
MTGAGTAMRICRPLALAAAVAGGACASPGTLDDPDAPEACVVLDNTGGSEAAGRALLLSEAGERFSVGEVTIGRSLRQCFRRSTWEGRWWLQIETPSVGAARAFGARGSPKQSEPFFIDPGDEVTWQVHRDRIMVGRIDGGT